MSFSALHSTPTPTATASQYGSDGLAMDVDEGDKSSSKAGQKGHVCSGVGGVESAEGVELLQVRSFGYSAVGAIFHTWKCSWVQGPILMTDRICLLLLFSVIWKFCRFPQCGFDLPCRARARSGRGGL